jgi:hypothetical protein
VLPDQAETPPSLSQFVSGKSSRVAGEVAIGELRALIIIFSECDNESWVRLLSWSDHFISWRVGMFGVALPNYFSNAGENIASWRVMFSLAADGGNKLPQYIPHLHAQRDS